MVEESLKEVAVDIRGKKSTERRTDDINPEGLAFIHIAGDDKSHEVTGKAKGRVQAAAGNVASDFSRSEKTQANNESGEGIITYQLGI
jgi:hypothetical protein